MTSSRLTPPHWQHDFGNSTKPRFFQFTDQPSEMPIVFSIRMIKEHSRNSIWISEYKHQKNSAETRMLIWWLGGFFCEWEKKPQFELHAGEPLESLQIECEFFNEQTLISKSKALLNVPALTLSGKKRKICTHGKKFITMQTNGMNTPGKWKWYELFKRFARIRSNAEGVRERK